VLSRKAVKELKREGNSRSLRKAMGVGAPSVTDRPEGQHDEPTRSRAWWSVRLEIFATLAKIRRRGEAMRSLAGMPGKGPSRM